MAMIDRNFTFATNGTVTANDLHNLIDSATIYQDLITGQQPITSVGTNYELLIADGTNPNAAPNAVTVYDLFEDALTAGTYTNANISAALTYGTATGTRLVSTNATITTGTITTGVIPALTSSTATFGTTTSTAATITSGTVTNLASTTGTIATLNSTTGTIATLNSTTGTIGNLSTTLAGDFTISSGTGTLGTTGVTAGTYGSASAIPFLTVDAKGRITSATSGTFSSIPPANSVTFNTLSTSATEADNVAKRTAKAWVNFDGTANSNLTGTYSQSGTAITVTITSHGLAVGQIASLTFQTGTATAQSLAVTTVTSSSVFVVTSLTSLTTSGNCTLVKNTIRSSFNVSSIADSGTGIYTVNFAAALTDVNYAVFTTTDNGSSVTVINTVEITSQNTSSCTITTQFAGGGTNRTATDKVIICVGVFGS